AVFEDQTGLGQPSHHLAFKSNLPGRVDAWAFVPASPNTSDGDWTDPVDLPADDHHDKVLANHIAQNIADMLKTGQLPVENDGPISMRKIEPRDILILVRSRQAALFSEIHRACKGHKLPVSGYDRLTVTEELAVKDILALLSFLATPEDDYALACALKSPLFGWSEQDMFDLSARRGSAFLWESLRGRSQDWPETVTLLNDLRARSDFLRPYDLLEYLLTDLKGRMKLVGRLGREAEESIDALVSLALDFEQAQVPGLTQFLVWLEQGDIEIKRQLDGRHNEVRIMTIHGSKGLEAPIVILPQTNRQNAPRQKQIIDDDGMVWLTKREELPNSLRKRDRADTATALEERTRLLYVALTRAESWLIVAGSGQVAKDDAKSEYWYKSIWNSLERLGASPFDSPSGPGLRYEPDRWPNADPNLNAVLTQSPVQSFDIPVHPPHPPAKSVNLISPSTLPGAKTVPGDTDGSPDALDYGIAVHRFLEILPNMDRATWAQTGTDATARAEAISVLDAPDMAWVFAPGSVAETPIIGQLTDDHAISGIIDRLVIRDDTVWIIDYKTNRVLPETPDDVPDGLVAQMTAYAQAMRAVCPDHVIKTAIIWTKTASLMEVTTPYREVGVPEDPQNLDLGKADT
ncbi:MAG: 3'-5' exonuclease, partial [Pseudomonadota bacterium]